MMSSATPVPVVRGVTTANTLYRPRRPVVPAVRCAARSRLQYRGHSRAPIHLACQDRKVNMPHTAADHADDARPLESIMSNSSAARIVYIQKLGSDWIRGLDGVHLKTAYSTTSMYSVFIQVPSEARQCHRDDVLTRAEGSAFCYQVLK